MLRARSISIWFFILLIVLVVLLRDNLGAFVPGLGANPGGRTTNTRQLATQWASAGTPSAGAGSSSVGAESLPAVADEFLGAAAEVAPASGAAEAPATPVTYTVQASDTLYEIAQRFGVGLEELARLNNLIDPNQLREGQVLRIPDVPALAGNVYVVQAGDTLTSIAQRFNISPSDLFKLNKLLNPNRLVTGARLLLPEGVTAAATTAATPAVSAAAASTPTPPPLPTSTPPPTPTPDPSCPNGERQAVIWGVSVCQISGWTLTNVTSPDRAVALTLPVGADLALFAVLRSGGLPEAPLSLVLLNAQRGLGERLQALPGNLTAPAAWSAVVDTFVDGKTARQAEAATLYAGERPAQMRVIVLNYNDQRWQVLVAAPSDAWEELSAGAFRQMIDSLRIF